MRLAASAQQGVLGATLAATTGTQTVPGLFAVAPTRLASLYGSDYYPLVLDGGTANEETVWLVAPYTAGSRDGTIVRAEEGTPAQVHTANVSTWANGPTPYDVWNRFDVQQYGAKGDGVYVRSDIVDVQGGPVTYSTITTSPADGTINSGTRDFTSAGGIFATTDQGKCIRITGAGAGGTDLYTFITLWVSATHVKVYNNAGTSVTTAHYQYGAGAMMEVSGSIFGGTTNAPTSLIDPVNCVLTSEQINYVVRVKGAGSSGDLITTMASLTIPGFANTGIQNFAYTYPRPTLAVAASTTVLGASWTIGPGQLTGTTTTGGSASTFTDSVNGDFAPGDVGKILIVVGAGPAGADLVTYITAVNANQKSVTMAHKASFALTGTAAYWYSFGCAVGSTAIDPTAGTGTTTQTAIGNNATLVDPYALGNAGFAFTTADTNKLLTVRNALQSVGWSGQPGPNSCNVNTLITTATYSSATKLTLGTNATAVSQCASYARTHDETAAILSAYAAAQAAGGGAVYYPDGLYGITSTLTIDGQANGDEYVTTPSFGNSNKTSRLIAMADFGIGKGGGGAGVASFKNQNDLEVHHLGFESNMLTSDIFTVSVDSGIGPLTMKGVNIHHCRFTENANNTGALGYLVKITSNGTRQLLDTVFSDNIIENCPATCQDALGLEAIEGAIVTGNRLENLNEQPSWYNSYNINFSGNTCRSIRGRGQTNGVLLSRRPGAVTQGNLFIDCDPVTILGQTYGHAFTGNTLIDTQFTTSSNGGPLIGVSITGNSFTMGPSAQGGGAPVTLGSAMGITFTGNVVENTGTGDALVLQSKNTGGTDAQPALADVLISQNIIRGTVSSGNEVIKCSVDAPVEPTMLTGLSCTPNTLASPTQGFIINGTGLPFTLSNNKWPIVIYGADNLAQPLITTIDATTGPPNHTPTSTQFWVNDKVGVVGTNLIAYYGTSSSIAQGRVRIQGNIIDALDVASGGVAITMNNTQADVISNTIRGVTNTNAINETGTTNNCRYIDNDIASGSINMIGAASVARDNKGFNPQGVAQITPVGVSPYTYTNNDNVDEVIYITGGTVTNIAKNSFNILTGTNVTNTSVWLEPGESLAVQYSSVPTMYKDRR